MCYLCSVPHDEKGVSPQLALIDVALILAGALAGILGAWLMRRRSTLSIRNVYPLATLAAAVLLAAILAGSWDAVAILSPLSAPAFAAAAVGRRWRLSDLGAGEELRHHELARRWAWQPAVPLTDGERRYIGPQSEIVRVRPWPDSVDYVPMTAEQAKGARLPLGAGHHVFECGETGTGKTTTARRLLVARTLAHGAAAMVLDQKGDPGDELELHRLAAAAGRPFVLLDPRDPAGTDRWAPLWGTPGDVAARAVESIKTSEPYYADVLRQHLNLIVEAELVERGVHVDGVSQHDAVQDEAERAELVLHPGVVALVELALVAAEYHAAEAVASFLEVADRFDVAAVGVVIEVGEDVQGLEDPPVGLDRLAEWGRLPIALQHPGDVVGTDLPGVDRRDHPQDVRPVPADPLTVDPAARGGVQRPVVRVAIKPPGPLIGHVRQLRAVLAPEQVREPEHQVAVGAGIGDDHIGALSVVLAERDIDHVQRVPGGAGDHPGGEADGLV
jgi:hypothetical protein